MSHRRTIVTHVLAAGAALGLAAALGLGSRQPEIPEMDPQKMMEQWMASIQPGKGHEFFKQFVGEWTTTTRVWMGGPGAPAQESAGTSTYSLILGGRFLKSESKGEMMGMPHEGLGLTGFDNNRKLYRSMWVDNMITGFITNTGNLDQTGKILTQFGEMDEPMTGEIGKPVKYVTRVVSPDQHVFEIWEVLYGDPFKVVEVEYNRKK